MKISQRKLKILQVREQLVHQDWPASEILIFQKQASFTIKFNPGIKTKIMSSDFWVGWLFSHISILVKYSKSLEILAIWL